MCVVVCTAQVARELRSASIVAGQHRVIVTVGKAFQAWKTYAHGAQLKAKLATKAVRFWRARGLLVSTVIHYPDLLLIQQNH